MRAMYTPVVFALVSVHFLSFINVVSIREAVTHRVLVEYNDVRLRWGGFLNLTERVMLCHHTRKTIHISTFFPFLRSYRWPRLFLAILLTSVLLATFGIRFWRAATLIHQT